MKRLLRICSLILGLIIVLLWAVSSQPQENSLQDDAIEKIRKRGYLLWGADAEGGAPYIFPSPEDPSRLIGFEVDLADAIAQDLGVRARHMQNAWDSLIPALKRGDSDIAMNGIEITPEREKEAPRPGSPMISLRCSRILRWSRSSLWSN